MNAYTFAVVLFLSFFGTAQTRTSPNDFGLQEFIIESDELGEVHYYVTKNKQDSLKPLLVYLDGSGSYPLFQTFDDGAIGSSVLLDFTTLSEDYHVVLISKPGVPFIDRMEFDEERGYPIYDDPEEYTKRLSLFWRVDAASAVIEDCIKNLPVNTEKIATLGISEGYEVGANLLRKNASITHSILMVGGGLNQLFDFIIFNRMEAESGKISSIEAQEKIDSLYQVYEDIYANPTSTDKTWYGHTYLRWASFTSVDPVDPIMESDVPVYMVTCQNDENSAPLSSDFATLEAIRSKRKDFTSVSYPYDHSFQETIYNEEGEVVDKIDHMREVLGAALTWLKEQ